MRSSTRHTRARRQLGNNNKMFPCDWFKGEPLISAPAIFRFSCLMWIYTMLLLFLASVLISYNKFHNVLCNIRIRVGFVLFSLDFNFNLKVHHLNLKMYVYTSKSRRCDNTKVKNSR